MGDVDKLMTDTQKQLDEHKVWLKKELLIAPGLGPDIADLVEKVDEMKLRMSRAEGGEVSILWEYPDELIAYLRLETTPTHLRACLEGGRVVDLNQPSFSAKRAP